MTPPTPSSVTAAKPVTLTTGEGETIIRTLTPVEYQRLHTEAENLQRRREDLLGFLSFLAGHASVPLRPSRRRSQSGEQITTGIPLPLPQGAAEGLVEAYLERAVRA